MLKTAFPIDFVRQVIEQTLLEEHINNPNYFGGQNQVNLFSFYEQLQKEDEVNRYVQMYRDLSDQQNRTGLIMNGTLIAPENPTITNLYSCTIIPMAFTCSFRVKLADRDSAINTINNLIEKLKGKKQDIALLDTGKLFKVGTMGQTNNSNNLYIKNGDFVCFSSSSANVPTDVLAKLNELETLNWNRIMPPTGYPIYQYAGVNQTGGPKIVVVKQIDQSPYWQVITEDGSEPNIVFPPQHEHAQLFKLSMSFDSVRCDEPMTLNANEYCTISFGGSATLVNKDVSLGNDLIKVSIKKHKIVSSSSTTFSSASDTWLEPLEQPSGNNANTRINQLISNNFVSNTHTDSIGISLQYTFVLDKSTTLLNQLWKYARFGKQGTVGNTYSDGVTPNMIYEVKEFRSYWGEMDTETLHTRIIESIDIENTESDVESITIPFQVQGDND